MKIVVDAPTHELVEQYSWRAAGWSAQDDPGWVLLSIGAALLLGIIALLLTRRLHRPGVRQPIENGVLLMILTSAAIAGHLTALLSYCLVIEHRDPQQPVQIVTLDPEPPGPGYQLHEVRQVHPQDLPGREIPTTIPSTTPTPSGES